MTLSRHNRINPAAHAYARFVFHGEIVPVIKSVRKKRLFDGYLKATGTYHSYNPRTATSPWPQYLIVQQVADIHFAGDYSAAAEALKNGAFTEEKTFLNARRLVNGETILKNL